MNLYGLYDIKENEQCILIGSIREIAKYLNYSEGSLRKYLHRKKQNENLLISHRYELTQVKDFEEEIKENVNKKSDKEIFEELLYIFSKEKPKFKEFNAFNWYLKGLKDKVIVNEEWKKIKGFHYSISNYGRIRNDLNKKIKNPRYHRWILQVDIYENSKRYTCDISRMVATYFIRPLEKNERVKHRDGDIRNTYYKNLEIVSK